MEDFKAVKGHEKMVEAFLAIGTSQASGSKCIEMWNVFGPAVKEAEGVDQERRIQIVTEVVNCLSGSIE
ncbi:hypothetical protein AOQ84DRAFT_382209 [Glonium stellatum]|uniref:Uncharacterized protein n=1 Tax=Glonium stellatum TaxID=574774 RepID=A0A8E2EQK3_9PEZI|nr:hypothetical protein AOQ84DRAFT_382209 [Glonium stellatum]